MKRRIAKVLGSISILLLISVMSLSVTGQEIDTTIVAKVMLIQKNLGANKRPIAAISVTFINTSDKDVYIPAILSRSREPIGGRVKIYRKSGSKYIPNGFIGKSLPDTIHRRPGVFENTISGSRNEIIDKYLAISTDKEKKQQEIVNEYLKSSNDISRIPNSYLKPLFLKAHEEYEIYLIKDVDNLVNIPDEYKIEYEFNYTLSDLDHYPTKILSYQRIFPHKISSNTLYTRLEP